MNARVPRTAGYRARGHLGPRPLLSAEEARMVNQAVEAEARPVPGLINRPKGPRYWGGLGTSFAWYKSVHAHAPTAREIATLPALVRAVGEVLGPDLILWGCELLRKAPGEDHRWHVDTECEEHGVTVWLPLENVGPASGIKFIDRSHRFPVSPQRLMVTTGLDLTSDLTVAAAARSLDPGARISVPRVAVGQFVIFPGKLWHASFNCSSATRSVLVLQYSPAGSVVRIPRKFVPPIEWHSVRPPILQVTSAGRSSL